MLLPLPPRESPGRARQRRALLAPQLFSLLLLVFIIERSLLQLPPETGRAVANAIAQLRLYADAELFRLWQLWSGPLLLNDWWQLLLALPAWLIWAPALERRLGTLRLAVLLALLLPATALAALHPQPIQGTSLLAGAQHLLLGMSLSCWAGERGDVLLLIPGLRRAELRRLRLSLLWPVVLLEALELLRVLLLDGMLRWPLPLLALTHMVVSLALGMFAMQLLMRREHRA